ncbi:MAG TPA: flavodoxin domain-containing protein [Acidimicrobiia bacterium]|nr:flavodoxin domain-containing protein [Acidimicrobiia bacterium]
MYETQLPDPVRVLVTAGSRHGATKEIAERIGEVLVTSGLEALVQEPQHVLEVGEFDVVVLGSAVYAGHWVREAKEVADLIAAESTKPLVWLFSSGPVGEPAKPEEDPVDVSAIVEMTEARGHRIFSGKIDKSKLNFGERAILIAVKAPEGDFRDWVEIENWAKEIADHLVPSRASFDHGVTL